MKLSQLLNNVAIRCSLNFCDVEIENVMTDSRKVLRNSLFVCLRGGKSDGHRFAKQAEENGAVALLAEEAVESSLPQLIVNDTREALAIVSGNFYGNPASELNLITIVGTNGKTSTAEILSEIFRTAGYSSATIGTLGYQVNGERREGSLTTPDPLDLHKNLAKMLSAGVKYVFLEASAHAIHYHKLAGIKAKATIFTNITRDHLDFFGTEERYAQVKLSYFKHENTCLAVVNSDDPYGRKLLAAQNVPMISYGIENPADVFAINIEEGESGLSFTINAFDRIAELSTSLFGRFNVYNIMAATATAMYLGVSLPIVTRAVGKMKRVPGRYEVKMFRGRKFVVDYAHTPDGLENLLSDIANGAAKRVITVFGCGGNRDRGKRPIMGKIASQYSDYVIITDDNPREEEEREIAKEILQGVLADSMTEVVLDRAQAIRRAYELSEEGDIIVIAGKGHENTMEIKGEKHPYNDFLILEQLCR